MPWRGFLWFLSRNGVADLHQSPLCSGQWLQPWNYTRLLWYNPGGGDGYPGYPPTHFLPCGWETCICHVVAIPTADWKAGGRGGKGQAPVPHSGFSHQPAGVLDPATTSAGTKGMEPCFVWGVRVEHFSAASLLGLWVGFYWTLYRHGLPFLGHSIFVVVLLCCLLSFLALVCLTLSNF